MITIREKIKILITGYNFGNPKLNGEFLFMKRYLKAGMCIFDVGANVGEFSLMMLNNYNNIELHCFEPVFETFNVLRARLKDPPKESKVVLSNKGLSNKEEKIEINIYANLAGTNSLYERVGLSILEKQASEFITIDSYIKRNNIDVVDFIKVDVEGHEVKVIEGAQNTIANDKIKCIMFEYGKTFYDANAKLEEVFNYLSNSFNIYRLTPWGKIKIKKFSVKLENYQYSNYVCLNKRDIK